MNWNGTEWDGIDGNRRVVTFANAHSIPTHHFSALLSNK